MINKISEETRQKIIQKSVHPLPDNPSQAGYRAGQIKGSMHRYATDLETSIIAEINRVIAESNATFGETFFDLSKIAIEPITNLDNTPNKNGFISEVGADVGNNPFVGVCSLYQLIKEDGSKVQLAIGKVGQYIKSALRIMPDGWEIQSPIARNDLLGISKPDGTTVSIDENGILTCNSSIMKESLINRVLKLRDAPNDPKYVPLIVQKTGQSTTDVMSQKAVTDKLKEKAQIDLLWSGKSKDITLSDFKNYDELIIHVRCAGASNDGTTLSGTIMTDLTEYRLQNVSMCGQGVQGLHELYSAVVTLNQSKNRIVLTQVGWHAVDTFQYNDRLNDAGYNIIRVEGIKGVQSI